MSEHPIFADGMGEIAESFVVETQELLDDLHADLLKLETADDPLPLIQEVFRAVHTVKGTSSFLGLDQLNTLTHHFEEVLNRLRSGRLDFQEDMMDVLFAAFDQMAILLQQVLDRDISPVPLDGLIEELTALGGSEPAGDGATQDAVLIPTPAKPVPSPPQNHAAARARRRSGSVRVDIKRLDDLIQLVTELTASRSTLSRIVDDLEKVYGPTPHVLELHEKSGRIDSLASEIRSVVLMTRMVTVERVFGKFPRVARDLARSLGKDVRICCIGADTEIDRSLADEIGEALLHLVRNAIDHGIEPCEVRATSGKPATGTITLEARREGKQVMIAIEDDGRGLDPQAILRKAVRLGRLSAQDAEQLTETEIYELIWEPGLSTTDVANRISGRGVGMDVVHTTVSRLNGSINVQSRPGVGTRFALRVPLTVSMTRSLIVEICGQTYALPQSTVTDVVALRDDELQAPTILYNGERIVIVRPVEFLEPVAHEAEEALVAVLDDGYDRCALAIDNLCGQEEIVHHPTGSFDDDAFISGVAVLCNGCEVPVLEGERIVRFAIDKMRRAGSQNPDGA